jgi:hypothetical protein
MKYFLNSVELNLEIVSYIVFQMIEISSNNSKSLFVMCSINKGGQIAAVSHC